MMKRTRGARSLAWLAVAVAFVAGIGVGSLRTTEAEPRPSPYGRLNTFARVLSYIERSYVDPVDEGRLIDAATKGMVTSLDPYSVYLTPDEYRALKEETDGEFVGVGLEVGVREGQVRVISPVEGAPAARAGVRAGDVLLEIDGRPVRDLTLQEIVKRLKGPKDSEVTVLLARDESRTEEQRIDLSRARTFVVTMKREVIDVVAVTWRMLDTGLAWVRVRSFQESVGTDVEQALAEIERKQGAPPTGIVLDLRNNPGGLLLEAVRVSDLFLDSGRIVSTRGRAEKLEEAWDARASTTRYKGRLVVLMNKGSASASEIVGAALKDNGRARVIGTRSYGKGSVQSIIDIKDGSGLKLTVARYYTPSGASIQERGVVPDEVVEARMVEVGAQDGPWYASDPQLARAVAWLQRQGAEGTPGGKR